MRSAAAIACCRLAFTRLSFLIGPYISSSAAMNAVNSPRRQAARRDLRGCRSTAPRQSRMPPSSSIDRRQHRHDPRHAHVRAIQLRGRGLRNFCASRSSAPNAFTMRWPVNDLGGHVRHVLERFLAAPRRLPQPPAELRQRIDDDRARRSGTPARAAGRSRTAAPRSRRAPSAFLQQIADRLRDGVLHLARRRSSPATAAARSCAARRSPPTAPGCARGAGRAGRARPAARRRPSGSRRSTPPMPFSR